MSVLPLVPSLAMFLNNIVFPAFPESINFVLFFPHSLFESTHRASQLPVLHQDLGMCGKMLFCRLQKGNYH